MRWRQLCGSLSILWHCLSLGLEWKLTFSSPVATAEVSQFAGILSAALSQHHLSGFEHLIFVLLFLTYFTLYNKLQVHLAHKTDSVVPFYSWVIFHCIYVPELLYPFFFRWTSRFLGCFHILAIINSVVMTTGVHVSFPVVVFSGYMPRSGIAESYGSFIPSFLRDLHTVLHSGCINLDSTNIARGFPFLHTLSSIYCLWFFLMIAILTGVRWYLIVVLIGMSLIISVLRIFSCVY